MPKFKSVKSLRQLSVLKLVDILWLTWRKSVSTDIHFGEHVHQVAAYLEIPTILVNDLMQELSSTYCFHTGHLLVFLHCGVASIDLTLLGNNSIDLDMLCTWTSVEHRQKVIYMNLCGRYERIPLSTLNKIPEAFRNLCEIHLPYTGCGDECVRLIMLHCTQLKKLDLTWCPFTDMGAEHLCNQCARECKLERLCIRGTNVTSTGAAKLLQSLPKLHELVFNGMFETFLAAHGIKKWNEVQDFEEVRNSLQTDTTHELRMVCINCVPYWMRSNESVYESVGSRDGFFYELMPDCIGLVVKTCPKLEQLSIVANEDIPEDSLAVLSRCTTNLTHFSIRCKVDRHRTVGFDELQHLEFEAILPVLLGGVGGHLRELTLSGVCDIDLRIIALWVPSLCVLGLHNISVIGMDFDFDDDEPPSPTITYTFPALKKLSLGVSSYGILEEILTHCNGIEDLSVFRLSDFTDHLIYRTEEKLLNLCRLSVARCPSITQMGILFLLLMHSSPLEELNLYQNKSMVMTQADLRLWVRSHNLDVQLTTAKPGSLFEYNDDAQGPYTFRP